MCWPHSPAVIFAIFLSTAKLMETKKTWENCLSAPIPNFRPSHCPYMRISNVKPAHVRWYIHTHYHLTLLPSWEYTQRQYPLSGTPYYIYKGNIRRRDIKSTYRRRLCCITAAYRFKVAKFEVTDSNVSKTSFRDWPYNWPEVSFHKINFVAHPRADRPFRVQR